LFSILCLSFVIPSSLPTAEARSGSGRVKLSAPVGGGKVDVDRGWVDIAIEYTCKKGSEPLRKSRMEKRHLNALSRVVKRRISPLLKRHISETKCRIQIQLDIARGKVASMRSIGSCPQFLTQKVVSRVRQWRTRPTSPVRDIKVKITFNISAVKSYEPEADGGDGNGRGERSSQDGASGADGPGGDGPIGGGGLITAGRPAPRAVEAMDRIVAGQTTLAFKLYRQLAKKNRAKNIFFSPTSLSQVLAMIHAGAKGKTARELENALGLFPSKTKSQILLGKLTKQMSQAGGRLPNVLEMASSLWADKSMTLRAQYEQKARELLGGDIKRVDFGSRRSRLAASRAINRWVANRTHKRIRKIVDRRTIQGGTRLIFANAVYFLGKWSTPFPKDSTRKRPFRLANGKRVGADMMAMEDKFLYTESKRFKLISLPYDGNRFRMLIILPKKGSRLSQVEKTLDHGRLKRAIKKLETRQVDLWLPRFTLRKSYRFKGHLKALGVRKVFSPAANLSLMASDKSLRVSRIVQKSYCRVDEKGTEAAAATLGSMAIGGAPVVKPVKFHADRPFLFGIAHVRSGALLFMGRVHNPK
jgi:serpin B